MKDEQPEREAQKRIQHKQGVLTALWLTFTMYHLLGCFSQPLWASEILRVKGGTKVLKYQMVTLRLVQCYNDQRGMRSSGFPKTARLSHLKKKLNLTELICAETEQHWQSACPERTKFWLIPQQHRRGHVD